MNFRALLLLSLVFSMAPAMLRADDPKPSSASKPNILFIVADDK